MFHRSTQGGQPISKFPSSSGYWPSSAAEHSARCNAGIAHSAGISLSARQNSYQEHAPQGAHLSSQTYNTTVPSAFAANLEPPSPFKWQHMSQQQAMQDPANLHKDPNVASNYTAAPGASTTSQSLLLSGPQQQQEQLHAATSGTASSMLYGKWKIEPAPAADASHMHDGLHPTAIAFGGHGVQDQHRMMPLQQQDMARQAQEQQMLLAAQARHQQQQLQQQAALVRSAEAAAASLASSRSLYSYHCATQQNYFNAGPAGSFSHNSQQQVLVPAATTGLPQHPAASGFQPVGSGWSDQSTATSSADAARTAMTNMYMQQRASFEQHRNFSSSAGTSAFANAAILNRQYGIIQHAAPVALGRVLSDANTATLGLMCNEDLLLDAAEPGLHFAKAASAALVMVSSPQVYSGFVEDSGSTNHSSEFSLGSEDDTNMEEDQNQPPHGRVYKPNYARYPTAAATTPTLASAHAAAEDAAAARHSMMMQMVGRTAEMRKGAPVLTASARRAAAAGAESVRSRLLITEVSVYTEKGVNSMMALNQANKLLSKMTLPDDIAYMPVSPESFLFKAGAAWQFPAFVICLGSSYLQRMFARLPQLAEAVMACPGFEEYCQYLPERYHTLVPRELNSTETAATLATLRSVQFTCLFLATKVADQIHALGLLRFMLTNLSHNGAVVTLQQASDVEARCLDALEWRLGPFYLEDELTGDDEELWAGSMGHWDYGGDRDIYPETFA